jgi:chemotaxis protein MotB
MVKRRFGQGVSLVIAAVAAGGCSFVPRSDLADCAKRCRALQAETAQLKDESQSLRSQNRDLSLRAIEDNKRLSGLEDANRGLKQSLTAYQRERDQMAAEFERLKSQLQAGVDSPPTTAARSGP